MPVTFDTYYNSNALEAAMAPELAREISIKIPVSTTILAGTVLGQLTATPGTYAAYATANTDGTQNATVIAKYDMTSDALGNITLGQASMPYVSQTNTVAPAFMCGFFNTAELVGLDAGAVGKLGRIVTGTLANGLIKVY